MRRQLGAAAIAAVVLLGACARDGGSGGGNGSTSGTELSAEIASYELVTGHPNRVLVGLFGEQGVVSYGSVDLTFSYVGTQEAPAPPSASFETTAPFILVPQESAGHVHEEEGVGAESGEEATEEMAAESGEAAALHTDEELQAAQDRAPEFTQPADVRGVYQATDVVFDRAGFWQVDVEVDFADGSHGSASATAQVVGKPRYPFPGDKAFRTDNLTIADVGKDNPAAAVDSRAAQGGTIPDRDLHAVTIGEAVAAGRPVVVVVSTPVYCQSRFCGPITDTIAALEERYGDRVAFVHLEVWRDFQKKVVNKAAAQWAYRGRSLTEPWVFLIGPDGRIADRWANVLDPRELAAQLEQLPAQDV